jgi:IS30 family transposase
MNKKNGRPLANIDWQKVNELLEGGCSGVEISGFLGLANSTLYERCLKDNKISFTEYSSKFYSKGDALIRMAQFEKALGKKIEGDNTLLIWLGKNRLKQKDKEEEISPLVQENINLLKQASEIFTQFQSASNQALINNSNDSISE